MAPRSRLSAHARCITRALTTASISLSGIGAFCTESMAAVRYRVPGLIRIGAVDSAHASVKSYHIDAVAEKFCSTEDSVKVAAGERLMSQPSSAGATNKLTTIAKRLE